MRRASGPDEARERLVALIARVAKGERAALGHVYDLTSAKLFGVALRILGDREDAEDVLQDVYLTVWNRADSFDASRASPITWLSTIARNRAIDRLRQLGPRAFDRPLDEAGEVAEERPDAFEALSASQEQRRLAACLSALDARTRSAIAAAFYGGLTYDELARRAGLPLGTMKSLIRRGLIRLRGCLAP
ncbi:sigma-70 family RNA polymerase sigma factor [Aurantimonas sp. Leaf443]|uniref:sigma-70 family RNA polymerase sigma factor n=1 Tax=Aurantimonas sp. Leaf443 TaxID=1736378 RepID=UPI0006F84874|nr:sigma-70 family RNA polymerase sigma factor [Aurantimonas sp. Leaf443]KQT83153.1 RNA polymerase subunit sigma [Aurantimonas sp. Leaf443]